MDSNRHINNAAYLVWALESLPEAWQEEHALIGIHLHFRKESHAGEQMKSLLFRQENLTCHHIMQGDELRRRRCWSGMCEWNGPGGQNSKGKTLPVH